MRWTKLSRRLAPSHLWRGFLGSVVLIFVFGLSLYPILSVLAERPSSELLRSLADIGIGLLVAWAVQSAVAVRSSYYRDSLQEAQVGSLVGSAACGFIALILVLALSERARAGHWIWADRLGFSLATSALCFLGICVVLLVYFTYEWSRQSRVDPPE